jgi:hypothetical protein
MLLPQLIETTHSITALWYLAASALTAAILAACDDDVMDEYVQPQVNGPPRVVPKDRVFSATVARPVGVGVAVHDA